MEHHTKQTEDYAQRLDSQTKWLAGLTVVLVIMTVALISIEVGFIDPGH